MTREEQRAELLQHLAKYRGGRFETSGSGGASGMIFFRDSVGRQFHVGGLQEEHAHRIVEALNLTMELLDDPKRDG
jgi:hypothetical protein